MVGLADQLGVQAEDALLDVVDGIFEGHFRRHKLLQVVHSAEPAGLVLLRLVVALLDLQLTTHTHTRQSIHPWHTVRQAAQVPGARRG